MSTRFTFENRAEAGRALAAELGEYASNPAVVVMALPRGGVPVAFEIARSLDAPLAVLPVRKLGLWNDAEMAMGAIAPGGTRVVNEDLVKEFNVSEQEIAQVTRFEEAELERRETLYRPSFPEVKVEGKIVILVDDGIATGATMMAAITVLKENKPAYLIIATPVAAFQTYAGFIKLVDELVCLLTPSDLQAISLWYRNFAQTTDEEVCELLEEADRLYREKHPHHQRNAALSNHAG